ncbi:MAG: hypothetical protein J6C85_06595 [Alphaproteobacteria bacterium]|nr:hypothetical protein [Alphaproteobacteria bacterium]
MDIKGIVSSYAGRNERGQIEIDLKGLAADKNFREQAIKAVVKEVQEKDACVLIPAFRRDNTYLSRLINELALTLQVKTLVTGDVKNLKRLRSRPTSIMLLKQSFRTGKELQEQIDEIKAMGCTVNVFCLLAHSLAKLQGFGYQNDVEIKALVAVDEIPYI